MGHYAKVINGLVVDVLVAEEEWIKTKNEPSYVEWVETSYNMRGGIYYNPTTNQPHEDQSLATATPGRKRKNYGQESFTYDKQRDAFIPPTPFPSWVLNEATCFWEPPMLEPNDSVVNGGNKHYLWNEAQQEWTYTGLYFQDGEIKIEGE